MTSERAAPVPARPGRDEIVAFARERFAFLEGAGYRPEVEAEDWRTVVAYVGPVLSVEIELDWREGFAATLVCRTVGGRRPPGYYAHGGRRMRVHLVAALAEAGAGGDAAMIGGLREVAAGSGPAAMREQLARAAGALRGTLDHLAARADRLFPVDPA